MPQERRSQRFVYGFYTFLGFLLTASIFVPWIDMDALDCAFHASPGACHVGGLQVSPHAGAISLFELGYTTIDLKQITIVNIPWEDAYDIQFLENETVYRINNTSNPDYYPTYRRRLQYATDHTLDLRVPAWGIMILYIFLLGLSLRCLRNKSARWQDQGWIQLVLIGIVLLDLLFFYRLWRPFGGVDEVISSKLQTRMIINFSYGLWTSFMVSLVTVLGFLSIEWQMTRRERVKEALQMSEEDA